MCPTISPQSVACPPPTRPRSTDQIVELFLHCWQEGHYTREITWPPQHRRNVTVFARDAAGERLALLRVLIRASDALDERLRPLAAALAADSRLDRPDRTYRLQFLPRFLEKALGQGSGRVEEVLRAWAAATLPRLAPGTLRHFTIPVPVTPRKSGRIRGEVTVVSGREAGSPAVSVQGCPAADRAR